VYIIVAMRRIVLPVFLAIAALSLSNVASASAVAAQDSPPYQPTWHLVYQTPKADWNSNLEGVTAPARDDAWAIGWLGRKNPTAYIVRWNGYHWRPVALPAKHFNPMYIDSSAPDDVWVFGYDSGIGEQHEVVYYWSASGWHSVPSPSPQQQGEWGTGGLVVNAADVWFPISPAVHWNGQRWQTVKLPRGFEVAQFADAGGTIWAIGTGGSKQVVRIYRLWHGQWKRMSLPYLRGTWLNVVVDGAHSVFVQAATQANSATAVAYWDGSSWRRLPAISDTPFSIHLVASYGASGLWQDSNILWTGTQWLSPESAGGQIPPTAGTGMATPRGTKSTWLVGQACNGLGKDCRGQIWLAGPTPR
jgi:hypothetical protein